MRVSFFMWALVLGAVATAQANPRDGFTKSPTEHIINRIDQPFVVQSVSGVITRETGGAGEPLQNVMFEIEGPGSDRKIRHATTDKNGRFEIHRVPAGTYVFKATLSGFQSVMGKMTVSTEVSKSRDIRLTMHIGV